MCNVEEVMETEEPIVDKNELSQDALEGWTKEDKFNLLQGLKIFGSHGVESISQIVTDKTEIEIKDAIDFYKRKMAQKVVTAPKKKGTLHNSITSKSMPLSSWAKILTDNFPFKSLQTETATALRLIANFEDIPEPSITGNINFKDLYETIADAMEGKTLPKDVDSLVIMKKCLLETAFDSRTFIKQSTLQTILDSVSLKTSHQFARPTSDTELATLQHLSLQQRYNPFQILEQYLKPAQNFLQESVPLFDD